MRILVAAATAAVLAGLGIAHAAIVDVLSGDVIQIEKTIVHIANIDAPPLDSPCPAVRRVAELARAKLAEFVSQGEMEIRPTGERDDDARPMAFVSVNGEDVGEKMIAARLAQRHGQAKPLCVPPPNRARILQSSPSSPNHLPPRAGSRVPGSGHIR
ncbi:MAG: hypothetical protein GC190_08130 [Alphaproteobacteria bacterium]|nr:hypothetical protein [Alphaproteobacteria bacterium]